MERCFIEDLKNGVAVEKKEEWNDETKEHILMIINDNKTILGKKVCFIINWFYKKFFSKLKHPF